MKSDIAFIIPPSPFLIDEKVFMSLGILKVAAVAEKTHNVKVLDLSGDSKFIDTLETFIIDNPSILIYGLTATTPQLPNVISINSKLKQFGKRVILGGPHITLINSAFKSEKKKKLTGRATRSMEKLFKEFDSIVCGDGELAIESSIKGEKFIDSDDVSSATFMKDEDFNNSPFPARHLIDVSSYNFNIGDKRGMSLIGQLGCPFACGFCSGRNSPTFRKIRSRTVENIIEEIDHLYKTYNTQAYMFYDDELNVSSSIYELLKELIQYQKQNNTKFNLRGCIKSELFNEVQSELMAKAGFKKLLVGFESGSDRILKNINKKATKKDNSNCIKTARKHGIGIKALMSIGHPGESEETLLETKKWLIEEKPDEFDVTIITVIPGSKYYDDSQEITSGIWKYTINNDSLYSVEVDNFKEFEYYKGIPGNYKSFVYTDHLSRESLVKYRDEIENDVRSILNLKVDGSITSILYEHSMGQYLNTI